MHPARVVLLVVLLALGVLAAPAHAAGRCVVIPTPHPHDPVHGITNPTHPTRRDAQSIVVTVPRLRCPVRAGAGSGATGGHGGGAGTVAGNHGGLAFTGLDAEQLLELACGLFVAGVGLMKLGRRPRPIRCAVALG